MRWENQIQRICESFNVDSEVSVKDRVDYMKDLSLLRAKVHDDLYDTTGIEFMKKYRPKLLQFICGKAMILLEKETLNVEDWRQETYLKSFSDIILGKKLEDSLTEIGEKITVLIVLKILLLELASADSVSGFPLPPIALKKSGNNSIIIPLKEAFKIYNNQLIKLQTSKISLQEWLAD
ncbi:MAG: hypothetical protein ACFFC7_15195 [Candidatus Hermodarchaeota archaeon]